MQKIFTLMAIASLIVTLGSCRSTEPATERQLQIAEACNENTQQMLSNELRFDKAIAVSKNQFECHLTLLEDPGMNASSCADAYKAVLSVFTKMKLESEQLKDDNVTITYVFNNADGSRFGNKKFISSEY